MRLIDSFGFNTLLMTTKLAHDPSQSPGWASSRFCCSISKFFFFFLGWQFAIEWWKFIDFCTHDVRHVGVPSIDSKIFLILCYKFSSLPVDSLSFDQDSGKTEFVEDIYEYHTRIPGTSWGAFQELLGQCGGYLISLNFLVQTGCVLASLSLSLSLLSLSLETVSKMLCMLTCALSSSLFRQVYNLVCLT